MSQWLQVCLSVGFSIGLYAASLPEALEGLTENPYGFAFIDVGVTEEDLAQFSSIDVQRDRVYHQFGGLENFQEIADFFTAAGSNESALALQAATRITQIVKGVIESSGKQTAWVYLRTFTPTELYDLPRWHLDGRFYMPQHPEDPVFKVAVTLVGPSTLFYLLPPELRATAIRHMSDRPHMKRFCLAENIVVSEMGQGAVFISNRSAGVAALHSEPPIHENRIFLSILPCMENQLDEVKARVRAVYPRDSRSLETKSVQSPDL